jgi:flagellar biosynthetic protein FliR
VLVSLLFLAIDGHHVVLYSLAKSFELIPLGGFRINGFLIEQIIRMGSNMFILGMKIATPVIIVLIVSQMAMGVMSRAVPQIQIFMVSFPVMIGIGLIVFGFLLNLSMSLLQGQMTGRLEAELSDILMKTKPS